MEVKRPAQTQLRTCPVTNNLERLLGDARSEFEIFDKKLSKFIEQVRACEEELWCGEKDGKKRDFTMYDRVLEDRHSEITCLRDRIRGLEQQLELMSKI